MIAPLRQIQQLVSASMDIPLPETEDPFLSRAHNALRSLRLGDGLTGTTDLVVLLRQAVLRSHLARGDARELRVPRNGIWPGEHTWRDFGCNVRRAGADHLVVEPRPWMPQWLDPQDSAAIDAALSEEPRRQARLVGADPRVTELTDQRYYFSPGQREAVRAAFLMPEGSATIVSLPTGAGKSLIFQLTALTWASQGGLTLVVVPTVALAREQEDRFRVLAAKRHEAGLAAQPFAYHSGLSDDAKRAVRDGVRLGTLPIVFVSPEAALGALRRPLFEAAREGRLRYFVVDEAHIVNNWGLNFRPDFQSLAGLRNALLGACPTTLRFRTLLLTATLTQESYGTLRTLFGDDCQLVSEVALRPEPSFLLHVAQDEEDRARKLMEAMHHLPRPLILYTTLRADALKWYQRLSADGFRRLRLVRGGDLSDSEGEKVLHEWRNRAVDIIVATSAFGLGVDQGDVRSVVHACLPESIDRYYQEVGRGGRDGNAAVALLLATPPDLETAQGLARETIISVERGFERWNKMWQRRRIDDDGAAIVSLDARPADIAASGERNAAWNLRTLVLMAQARLVEFAAHSAPFLALGAGEDPAAFEERRRQAFEQFSREAAVRVRDVDHLDSDHWNDAVLRTRETLRDVDRQGCALLEELYDLRRPLNDIFRELYTLRDPALIHPPRLAGSCPVTRAAGAVTFLSSDPEITTLSRTSTLIGLPLERVLSACRDDSGRCWITYDSPVNDARSLRRWRETIVRMLRHVIVHGVVELCLPSGFLREKEWHELLPRSPLQFLLRAQLTPTPGEGSPPEMPRARLTLLDSHTCGVNVLENVMQLPRLRHIVVLPRDVSDPRRPSRPLFNVERHLELDSFLETIES